MKTQNIDELLDKLAEENTRFLINAFNYSSADINENTQEYYEEVKLNTVEGNGYSLSLFHNFYHYFISFSYEMSKKTSSNYNWENLIQKQALRFGDEQLLDSSTYRELANQIFQNWGKEYSATFPFVKNAIPAKDIEAGFSLIKDALAWLDTTEEENIHSPEFPSSALDSFPYPLPLNISEEQNNQRKQEISEQGWPMEALPISRAYLAWFFVKHALLFLSEKSHSYSTLTDDRYFRVSKYSSHLIAEICHEVWKHAFVEEAETEEYNQYCLNLLGLFIGHLWD